MQRNSNPWSLMQQRFQHAEGQKSEMKQAAHQPKSSNQSTAQLWYQPKRIPLYIAVAGGLIGAATFFWTKSATHPQVETSKHHRYLIHHHPFPSGSCCICVLQEDTYSSQAQLAGCCPKASVPAVVCRLSMFLIA